jgi:hypothetical protein
MKNKNGRSTSMSSSSAIRDDNSTLLTAAASVPFSLTWGRFCETVSAGIYG